jgi:hypothetical protein
VTGTRCARRSPTVLAEQVAGPLGVADQLYFGMPPSEHWRLARLGDAADAAAMMSAMPADLPMFKAGPPNLFPTAELGRRTDILTADIPAGGKTSARAIARMYAALLEEVDRVRLISPRRLREATAPAASGVDEVFGMPSTWALATRSDVPIPLRRTARPRSGSVAPAEASPTPTPRLGSRSR